jgi:hypothetical protein
MLVRVICSRKYKDFPGGESVSDLRIFDCTDLNCYPIAEQMKSFGWEVELEHTGEPAYFDNENKNLA